jgi:hypothetical protein
MNCRQAMTQEAREGAHFLLWIVSQHDRRSISVLGLRQVAQLGIGTGIGTGAGNQERPNRGAAEMGFDRRMCFIKWYLVNV